MWVSAESAFTEALDHLEHMSRTEGFKHHAWHQAKELDAADHGMYRGIAKALIERMKTKTEKTEA